MSKEIVPSGLQHSNTPATTLRQAIEELRPFPKTSILTATEAATRMLGCYPNGKPADPKTYLSAVVAVLADYPPEIVAKVTDPASGVAIRQTFLPSIAEIHAALENEMSQYRRLWKEELERGERAKDVPQIADPEVRERMAKKFAELSKSLGEKMRDNGPFTYGADEGRRPPRGCAE